MLLKLDQNVVTCCGTPCMFPFFEGFVFFESWLCAFWSSYFVYAKT